MKFTLLCLNKSFGLEFFLILIYYNIAFGNDIFICNIQESPCFVVSKRGAGW